MGVFDTLSSISGNIENIYSALSSMGATIPQNKNLANVAQTIQTLPSGSAGDDYTQALIQKTITNVNDTYNKITYVRPYAFYSASALSSINLPVCREIGIYAFDSCTLLSGNLSLSLCEKIESYAFRGCSLINELYLPMCSFIGAYAFNSAPFSEIDLPEAVIINASAFYGAKTNLKTLSLPKVQSIGAYAFASASITSLYLPECSIILGGAFQSAYALTEINLPVCKTLSGIAVIIQTGPFTLCSNLTTASIPLCEILGAGAFRGCSQLSQLVVPNCTAISAQALYGCMSLSALVLGGSSVVGLANKNAFTNTPMSASSYLGYYGSIYVPTSLYNSYITATNWVTYSARITSQQFTG